MRRVKNKKKLLTGQEVAKWILIFAIAIMAVYIVFGQPAQVEVDVEPVAELPREEKIFDVPIDAPMQQFTKVTCEAYGNVEMSLPVAIMGVESNFEAHKVNEETGCYGIMQIQLESHKDDRMVRLGVTDLLDPYQNILTGIDYLSYLLKQSDDMNWVLNAYHGGIGHANGCRNLGIQTEYAETVLAYQEILEREIL